MFMYLFPHSIQLMQKLRQKTIEIHFQTTIDPESIVCKIQKESWRDSRGSSKSSWVGQNPINHILEGLFQMTYPCAWLLPWELFLQLTGQKDRGSTHLLCQKQQLCPLVSTEVQGTEQTALQAMRLLAWHKKPHTDCHTVITILPITSWSCRSSP